MPRYKEFDVEEVQQKAMEAFWDYGYEATTLDDLLDKMGIHRASLYNAFGNKRTIFLETLHRYNVIAVKIEVKKRIKAPSPRQAILDLFQDKITVTLLHGERKGCFLVNTATEISPHDKEVAEITNAGFTYLEKNFFYKMVQKGRAMGEIDQSVVSTETARALLSLYIGLCVLTRCRPEKNLMQSILRQAKLLLPPGKRRSALAANGSGR